MSAPNLRLHLAPQYDTNRIKATLEACKEYFKQRADAEYFADSAEPVGNEEAHLLVDIEDALPRLAKVAAAYLEGLAND